MYKAKDYRTFHKVWRKYAKKYSKKYHGAPVCFVMYQLLDEEEMKSYLKDKGFIGKLMRVYMEKFHKKKMMVDTDVFVTFVGMNLTNIGVFYIVDDGSGNLQQVHQSYLAFIK